MERAIGDKDLPRQMANSPKLQLSQPESSEHYWVKVSITLGIMGVLQLP
jgi:hypothetical protein